MNKPNNRTMAREFALKFFYHLLISKSDALVTAKAEKSVTSFITEEMEQFSASYQEEDSEHPQNKLTPEIYTFGIKLLNGSISNSESMTEVLTPTLKNSRWEKLHPMSQVILLLSYFEISELKTPYQIVINEAVNLAKKYGSPESASLINGVLDAICKK